MGKYDAYYNAIEEIKESLTKELFGTEDEETLNNVEPLSAYVTGILFPQKASEMTYVEEDADTYNANDDINIEDISESDDAIIGANRYKPSTMGISVVVPASAEKLDVTFRFGTYRYERKEVPSEQEYGEDQKSKRIKQDYYYRKQNVIEKSFDIPTGISMLRESFTSSVSQSSCVRFDITLTVRKILRNNSKLITVSAVNRTIDISKLNLRNECPLFQCKLTLSANQPFLPVFQNSFPQNDIESQIRALLYSSVKNFAYGHGCSVEYDESDGIVSSVVSTFLPTEQVLQMLPGEIACKEILSLQYWKNADRVTACQQLLQFIDEYETWKKCKEAEIPEGSDFSQAYRELMSRIETCISRLKNGAAVLQENDKVWKSFVLMNEAMLLQRINTKGAKPETISWYPFQLAYILQIVPDIVNPDSEYRNYTDLLWFPTGGGKTEAYLGVAAFTIFFRRMVDTAFDDGVSVIMRYTLRLLTIQQFERAAALICACEFLRKQYGINGGEISIGLWIGSGMTPNSIDKAAEVLDDLKQDRDKKIYEGNPVQITKCPWCGSEIDITGYSIENRRLNIRCSDNSECPFHHHLPVYVVDEDIYARRPTLLLSTIDKFARIAWEDKAGNLFDANGNPPSLIIQDELHLISGALGSLAGLYEIAVDWLCRKNNTSPKIIASTATVKNADEQILNIYGQKMMQFPPNGISYDDTFFSHIADKNARPARTYIGACENGGSIADLLIRVYAVLMLMKARMMKENKPSEVIDQYYTAVGYFNAIRDLGSTANILQDRMYTQIRALLNHKFQSLCEELELTTKDIPPLINEELTSRKSAKEIKETLDRLERNYNKSGCYAYILASNMLSVGIDINRLGLMTVYNQPKTNSEYIQATSRVGRQNPGLVIALYNPMRSRDKSHYEQFGFYHKSFYQYVEATSVTPFSAKALEKALHCIFVAMVRHSIPQYAGNNGAAWFRSQNNKVKSICDFIINRVQMIHPKASAKTINTLKDICMTLDYMSGTYPDLCYKADIYGGTPLLISAEGYAGDFDFPPALNSLRNVEPSSNIYFED